MPITDTGRAEAHIKSLQAAFPLLSVRHISRLAGLGEATLNQALRSGKIAVESEEFLLAVLPRHVSLRPPPRVGAEKARAHLEEILRVTGCFPAEIVTVIDGMDVSTVYDILRGKAKTVRWRNHEAILACSPHAVRHLLRWTTCDDSISRIRALQAIGYSLRNLGGRLGFDIKTIVLRDLGTRMERSTADAILALYEELRDTPGPSAHVASRAASAGYLAPDRYDDEMRPLTDQEWKALVQERKMLAKQEKARDDLRIVGLSLDGRSSPAITAMTGLGDHRVVAARKAVGITVEAGYVELRPKEMRPGAIAAAKRVMARIDYWTPVDAMDEPGLDYVALFHSLSVCDDASEVEAA